jgi:hypothetical protein
MSMAVRQHSCNLEIQPEERHMGGCRVLYIINSRGVNAAELEIGRSATVNPQLLKTGTGHLTPIMGVYGLSLRAAIRPRHPINPFMANTIKSKV